MNVDYKPEREVTSTAAKAATGRTLEEWYAELDAHGGTSVGRRVHTEYLFRQLKVEPWWTTTIIVEYEKARGVLEKDGLPKGYNICATKALTAEPAAIFEQFSDASWWLSKDAQVVEGSTFDDGDGHKGVFKKVTAGKVIRFTWDGKNHHPGEVIEIKSTTSGGKTSVMMNHDRLQTRAAADGMRAAWGLILNRLKDRLS